jgi:hypothetical protein
MKPCLVMEEWSNAFSWTGLPGFVGTDYIIQVVYIKLTSEIFKLSSEQPRGHKSSGLVLVHRFLARVPVLKTKVERYGARTLFIQEASPFDLSCSKLEVSLFAGAHDRRLGWEGVDFLNRRGSTLFLS